MGYDVPHVCPIDGGGFTTGKMVKVHGTSHATASRFAINIQTGPNLNPRDDIVLHISAIFAENALSRASYQSGVWGPEERTGTLPFSRSQPFDIIVLCDAECYKIAINGQHFAEFIHRMPYQRATHVVIEGDLQISHIGWEGGSGGGMGVGGFAPPTPTGGMYPNLAGGIPPPYPTGPVPVPPYSGAGYVPPPPPVAGYNPGPPHGGYSPAPSQGGYNPAASHPIPGYTPQPGYGAPSPYGGQPAQPGYAPYPGYGGHQPPPHSAGYGPPPPPGYGGQQPYGAPGYGQPGYGQPGYGPPPPPGYDAYYGKQSSSDDFGEYFGKAGAAIAGALGTAGILGAITGQNKGDQKSSDSGILGKVGGALGLGAGAAVLGSVLGKKSHIPGMPHSGGGGMLGKVGTALGLGTGAAALGGALAGKKHKSKGSKALKYGVPIAGLGVGAYAASKMVKGFHGSSSSSSSSSEEE